MGSLTQHALDNYITEYLVESVLPINHVDTPALRKYTETLTAGQLTVHCRQTILEDRFNKCKEDHDDELHDDELQDDELPLDHNKLRDEPSLDHDEELRDDELSVNHDYFLYN